MVNLATKATLTFSHYETFSLTSFPKLHLLFKKSRSFSGQSTSILYQPGNYAVSYKLYDTSMSGNYFTDKVYFCFPFSHVEMACSIIQIVMKKVAVVIRRTSKGKRLPKFLF